MSGGGGDGVCDGSTPLLVVLGEPVGYFVGFFVEQIDEFVPHVLDAMNAKLVTQLDAQQEAQSDTQ